MRSSPIPATMGAPVWVWRGQVPSLDGLRAVAILLVILSHAASCLHGSAVPARFLQVAGWGRVGVDMFFVISGFLITLLLLRESARTGTVSLKGFYLRRGLRILPAYVVFLLGAYLLTRGGVATVNAGDWLAAGTYTTNFVPKVGWAVGHTWSLCVEEHFYLLWPLLLLLVSPRRALLLAAAYVLAAPLIRLLVWTHWSDQLNFEYATITRMDSIAVGCCLAFLVTSGALSRRLKLSGWVAGAALVFLAGLLLASRFLSLRSQVYYVMLDKSVTALCFAGMIWLMTHHPEGWAGRVLNAKPLVAVGVLSYSLYLWQQPLLNPHSGHWLCRFPLNLILLPLLALGSYLLVESPFLRWKDRLSASRQVPRQPVSPGAEPALATPEAPAFQGAGKPVVVPGG